MRVRLVALATPSGFEPPISSVTGRHVRPLHHGAAGSPSIYKVGGAYARIGSSSLPSTKPSITWATPASPIGFVTYFATAFRASGA